MNILNFDEINKYKTYREWLEGLTPSEVMENKQRIRDDLWDLLEYLYMLGFTQAYEEVGGIAEDVIPFLPDDYDDRRDEEIYRKWDDKDFADRVTEYAEMGDVPSIIRVAETDGNRVFNSGGLLGATTAGATTKTWRTMMDDRVRDLHDPLEGVTVPIDGYFVAWDGDKARYPGDFSEPQGNINCRCWCDYE